MRGLDVVGADGVTHGWWQTGVTIAAVFVAAALEIVISKKAKR
jgi:hypothetical protein